MTAQASNHGKKLYGTKDQDMIIMLLTFRKEIIKTGRDGKWTIFYFDRASAEPLILLWNTGKPIPVSDLRDVYRAYDIFNQVTHGEL